MPRSISKGAFVDDHLLKKVEQMNQNEGPENHQDLVAAIDRRSRYDRAYVCRS